jgi:fluoride exporter
MTDVVMVLLGGALGAPARYLTDVIIRSRYGGVLPWGTFIVNVVGSLILGGTAAAVASTGGPDWVLALVGTGFCGALTTFSAFGYETVRLVEDGSLRAAGLNVVGSVVVAMAACAGGWALVSALVP